MKSRARLLILVSASVAVASAAAPALASGRLRSVAATPIFVDSVFVAANNSLRVETLDLSLGSDTVVHLQSTDGRGLAGNDDCLTDGTRHSCVDLAPTSASRTVMIFVRAFSNFSAGTARMRVFTPAGGERFTSGFAFAGQTTFVGNLRERTEMFTTRTVKGASDTVIVAFHDTLPGFAPIIDDDSGVSFRMSKAVLPFATQANTIVVGAFGSSQTGTTSLVWDQDVGNGLDSDGDGLGNGLETALGTCVSITGCASGDAKDSDKDGIGDGFEVRGTADLLLPAWGAEPTVQDLFVEADWNECLDPSPGCSGGLRDAYRMTGAQADETARLFGDGSLTAPRVAVHMDIGVDNPAADDDPALKRWGNWGGAFIRNTAATDCSSSTASRAGFFHFGVIDGRIAGSAAPGTCFNSNPSGRVVAHELGHNVNLGHGGMPASKAINNKPIYASVMNYAYQNNVKTLFSRGTFMGVSYSPRSINEQTWRGSNTASDLSLLTDMGYKVVGNAVDWNRDGAMQTSTDPVRAAATTGEEIGRWRDYGHPSGLGGVLEANATLAWWASASGPRLYVLTQRSSDNLPTVRFSTDIEAKCSVATTREAGEPACGTFSAPSAIPNAPAVAGGAGLADFAASDGTRKMMAIYRAASDNKLRFQIAARSSSTTAPTTWTAPTVIDSTAVITSDVAAVFDQTAGRIEVFAVSGGVLKRWSFRTSTNAWDTKAVTQQWANGTNIAAQTGIGLTFGHHRGDSTKRLFALVPYAKNANADFARRSATANRWDLLSTPLIKTDTRPGLAYVPFKNADVTAGRFVAIVRDVTFPGSPGAPATIWTEGNDPASTATTRRLVFSYYSLYYGQYDRASANSMSLVYDPARDTNLRGAYSAVGPVFFQGVADGAVNTSLSDQDDRDMIKANLACSFATSNCRVCTRLNANGTCAQF